MIKNLIPLKEFKLQEFIDKTLELNKTVMGEGGPDPSALIFWLESNLPKVYDETEGRSNFLEQLDEGKTLFFPFSSSMVNYEVFCANNKTITIDSKGGYLIGELDCFGYTLNLYDNELTITSAIYYGGGCNRPPCIELSDCDIFEVEMDNYLDEFKY